MKNLFENWRKHITEKKEFLEEFKQADKDAVMAASDRFTISYEIELNSRENLGDLAFEAAGAPTLREYAANFLNFDYFSENAWGEDADSFWEWEMEVIDVDDLIDKYTSEEIEAVPPDSENLKNDRDILRFEIAIKENMAGAPVLYDSIIKDLSTDGSRDSGALIKLLLNNPEIRAELSDYSEMKATQLGLDFDAEDPMETVVHVLTGIDNTELFKRYVFDLEGRDAGFPIDSRYRNKVVPLELFLKEAGIEQFEEIREDVDELLQDKIINGGNDYTTNHDVYEEAGSARKSDSEHLSAIGTMVENAIEAYHEKKSDERWEEYQASPLAYLNDMGWEVEDQYYSEYPAAEDAPEEHGMYEAMEKHFPQFIAKYGDQLKFEPDLSLDTGYNVEFSMDSPKYITGLQESLDHLELFFHEYEQQDNFYMDNKTGLHTNVGYMDEDGVLEEDYNLIKALLFLNDQFATKGFETRAGSNWAHPIKEKAIQEIAQIIQKEVAQRAAGEERSHLVYGVVSDFVENNYQAVERALSNAVRSAAGQTGSKGLGFNIHYLDQRKYIEFRYPGHGELDFEKMKKATLYYAHIIKAATDPEYKKADYFKKLTGLINNLKSVEYEKVKSIEYIKALKKGDLLVSTNNGHNLRHLWYYLASEEERDAGANASYGRGSEEIPDSALKNYEYYIYKGINSAKRAVIVETIEALPHPRTGEPHLGSYQLETKEIPMIFFEKDLANEIIRHSNEMAYGYHGKKEPVNKAINAMFEFLRQKGTLSTAQTMGYIEKSQPAWELRDEVKAIRYDVARDRTWSWEERPERMELYKKYKDKPLPISKPDKKHQKLRQLYRKLRLGPEEEQQSSEQQDPYKAGQELVDWEKEWRKNNPGKPLSDIDENHPDYEEYWSLVKRWKEELIARDAAEYPAGIWSSSEGQGES